MHYTQAEVEVFSILHGRMHDDGMKQEEIREHFAGVFGLGYSAFYQRLRKVKTRYEKSTMPKV